MQGLRRQAGNYAHALHQVPRNSRHLYVHAYQSFLWNTAASHRVQTYGIAAAVAGDLVIPVGTACGAPFASAPVTCSLFEMLNSEARYGGRAHGIAAAAMWRRWSCSSSGYRL